MLFLSRGRLHVACYDYYLLLVFYSIASTAPQRISVALNVRDREEGTRVRVISAQVLYSQNHLHSFWGPEYQQKCGVYLRYTPNISLARLRVWCVKSSRVMCSTKRRNETAINNRGVGCVMMNAMNCTLSRFCIWMSPRNNICMFAEYHATCSDFFAVAEPLSDSMARSAYGAI